MRYFLNITKKTFFFCNGSIINKQRTLEQNRIRDRDIIYDHPISPTIKDVFFDKEEDDEDDDSLLY